MKHHFPGFIQNSLRLGLLLAFNLLFTYSQAQTLVFSEDFELWTPQNPSLPPGWLLGPNSCTSSPACYWAQPTRFPMNYRPSVSGCDGSNLYARAYTSAMTATQKASMITPNIDLSNFGSTHVVRLTFCLINPNSGTGGVDELGVSFSTDGGQSWQSQLQDVGVYDTWTSINLDIPLALRGNNFRILFEASGRGDGMDIGIDEVVVTQQSASCIAGNSMVSSTITGQVCKNHEIDISILDNDDTSGADYAYILADALNRILGVLPSNQVDFNFLPANDYRIYGFSYTGTLLVNPGQLIQTASASVCHTLSSNYASFFVTDLGLGTKLSDYNGYGVSIAGGQDGTIEITSPPSSNYSYLWVHDNSLTSPILSQLAAGNYQVLVTDPASTCTDELTISLESPTPLIGNIEITTDYNGFSTRCFDSEDASLKAFVRGGVRPYRYAWQGSPVFGDSVLNDLGAGSYVLSVIDNNGALIQLQKEIVAAPEISIENFDELVYCFGQNVEIPLQVSGGAGNYIYLWANGSTNGSTLDQNPGLVSLSIEDENACIQNFELEIRESPEIKVDPIVNSPQCANEQNGSILLFTTGGTEPYTFDWSNGSTEEDLLDLGSGSYQVKITDEGGCEFEQSFELDNPAPLNYTLDLLPDNGNGDGAARITVEGGIEPFTYTWSNGATGSEVKNLKGGNYSVIFSDASNCSQEVSFEIERPLRPDCLDIHMGFSPNGDGINDTFEIPCIDFFPQNELQIVNRWGQELFYAASYDNSWGGTSNGKALAEGTYFYIVKFDSPEGKRVYKGSVSIIK